MQDNPAPLGTSASEDTRPPTIEQALLVTKLTLPPFRTDVVPRPRLSNRLQLGIHSPLTLIAAPAGFGKTTLLSTWLERASLPAAWLSLEQDDDDLARFWSYVFTALAHVHAGLGTSALSLLRAPALAPLPSIETVLAVWLNELATLPRDTALVLDDYHLITAPAIHRAVTYLVDHLPPQLHLVLATRADPPLPLARLRARGHLTEIRAADLRFTSEETAAFLTGVLELPLSAEEIATLEARTEGWIVGLQLAALSMQGRKDMAAFLAAFSGSHRYVIDYLVEEVLTRQPEPVQTFLLQTSILDRLQGSLCEAVVGVGPPSGGETSGQAMLEQLERANLFLAPLDDFRQWYRYHPLFAEALRHRLQRGRPDLVPDLHRRASTWYEQHDMTREAVRHALSAADFAQAARLIEHVAELTARRGELATLHSWLESLPAPLVRARVELCLWQGWLLALSGEFDAAEQLLFDLEPRLRTSAPGSQLPATSGSEELPGHGVGKRGLIASTGRVAAIRAFIAFRRGDYRRTIDLALRALAQLPEDQAFRGLVAWYLGIAYLWSGELAKASASLGEARVSSLAAGNSYAAFMAIFEMAQTNVRQGHLHQAEQSYQQALELAAERGEDGAFSGPAYIGRGEISYERNDLEEASRFLGEGIARCQQTGNAAILLLGYVALTRVKQAQRDTAGAHILIQKIEQILHTSHLPPLNAGPLAAWHARLALAQGDLALASRWAREQQLGVDDELSPPREREYLTWVRLLIAQHRSAEGLPLLVRLLLQAERQERMGNALEILVVQAVAELASGNERRALARLSQALSLAEPEGYIRVFIDEGEPIARLLKQMRARRDRDQPCSPDYQEHLLAELGRVHDGNATHSAGTVPGSGTFSLAEPLSERELEVLRLIVAGCSNREIADRLVIAVSTVKWHVNAIYGKLQVESRTRAIARARDLNIV